MSEENSKENRIETTKREFWWGSQDHGMKLRMKDDLDLGGEHKRERTHCM
jgi:hypothetical protein